MDANELLTTNEAAEIKGCTARYLNKLIREGRLEAIKKGRLYLIRQSDLENIKPAKRPVGRPAKPKEARSLGNAGG